MAVCAYGRPWASSPAPRPAKVDLGAYAQVLGEVSLAERALQAGLQLVGPLAAVLLVENLGAWRDLVPPPGWLIAYVLGWNTTMAVQLLACIGQVPALHFGDLDANGARIHWHLCQLHPSPRWFVPPFCADSIDLHGQSAIWPTGLDLSWAPALVQTLAARGLWLEQEPLVVDPRLGPALEAAVA